jgi:hypothetical protein
MNLEFEEASPAMASLWRWFMVPMRVDEANAFGFSAVTL